MCAVLQRWAPSNGKHCVPIVFSLMSYKWAKFHPVNRGNVYYSQARRQDFTAGEPKITRGNMFKTQYWMYAATATKKVACGMVTLFTFTSTQKVVQIWMPKRPSNVICSIAIWAREETRNSIFCKSTKLLSSCKLFSHFTFAPAFSFMSHKLQHISRFAIQQKWANRRYNVAIETQ